MNTMLHTIYFYKCKDCGMEWGDKADKEKCIRCASINIYLDFTRVYPKA